MTRLTLLWGARLGMPKIWLLGQRLIRQPGLILLLFLMAACARPAGPATESPTMPPNVTATTASPRPTAMIENTPTAAPAVPTATTPARSDQAASGVEGRVELGPTCGNVPLGQEANCVNKPYQAKLTIVDPTGQVVATGMSGADGTFRFALPPGRYRLEPESVAFLSASSLEFSVEPDAFTSLTVLYHTNIQ